MFAETITELIAYHEAGHAVVGHVIGRCIESVALLNGENGYGGHCLFSSYAEDANGHPGWNEKHANPDLITIYYAGMLSTAQYCSFYLALDEEDDSVRYPEGSERADLERIQEILSRMNINQQQSKALSASCWTQAQKILSEYRTAVDALANALVKRGSLTGRAAHLLIWQTTGYPAHDWRFVALDIKAEHMR